MTERQRTRLLNAYLALALLMGGALLHDFLSHTLINVQSDRHLAEASPVSTPSAVTAPDAPKVNSTARLPRTAGSGKDEPAVTATGSRLWPDAAAVRPSTSCLGWAWHTEWSAHRPRGPPFIL